MHGSFLWRMIHEKNHGFTAKCREADILNELLWNLWRHHPAWIETAIIHLSLSALIILSDITTTTATAAATIGMVFQPPALPRACDSQANRTARRETSLIRLSKGDSIPSLRIREQLTSPAMWKQQNILSNNVRQLNLKRTIVWIWIISEECTCQEGVYQIITPTSVKMSVQHDKC